ncbi:polyprenyl synthetase family protein [Paraliomyxa miuraensis]|uniref:polyprenyl synthetase family protein n=1 Tax=Paraliomyxa miuraensis TaxID=376150 RepID=UPI00224DC81C|nr:polyprenyl synthetase family protein [Paraliomyxa miuraensis]
MGAAALIEQALRLVADDLATTERHFAELLASEITVIPEVAGHVAFAGGKRFRPLLTLLAAEAAGFEEPERLTVAAVGELLHTATLLHDDVIDEGEFRRGRPAARMGFGNGMAVLSGDYCLARALQAVAYTGRDVAVRSLADCVTRMAEGEVAQLHGAGCFQLDREHYRRVIDRKTAALIAWCASVAGLVAPRLVEPLRRFGHQLGHAFQIVDDVLDVRPAAGHGRTPGHAGKDPGQDLREGKMTLPLILACEHDPELRDELRALLEAGPPVDEATVGRLLPRIQDGGAPERALAVAREHVDHAVRALHVLPPSPAHDALVGAAYYVVHRSL